jgi:hypothetical protein
MIHARPPSTIALASGSLGYSEAPGACEARSLIGTPDEIAASAL